MMTTKIFAGKKYSAYSEHRTKPAAQAAAKTLRKDGYNARVTKGWGFMWIVWRRR